MVLETVERRLIGGASDTHASLYSVVWMIGIARSIALRPSLIGPDYLDLKFGLVFRLCAKRDEIAVVRPATMAGAAAGVVVPRGIEPNVVLELTRGAHAEGLLGTRTQVSRIALTVDAGPEFLRALGRPL